MSETSKTGLLVGVIGVLSLALGGAGSWIVFQQMKNSGDAVGAPAVETALPEVVAPVPERSEPVVVQAPTVDVERLQRENADLKVQVGNLEKRLKEMEEILETEKNRTVDLVYGPLAAQIATGNELLAILKRLNEPLTDLQREAAKKDLKGFLGDHDGQPAAFKGHVSRVTEKIIGSNLILNIEVLEGVKISFEASPNQKGVLEELNASYEVVVVGRLKSSLVGKFLPGQHFKLSFTKSVSTTDYANASALLNRRAK